MTHARNDDRFWAKVERTPDCWLWTASTTNVGVGQFRLGRTNVPAHRYAWQLIHGAAPAGDLRHGCGNMRCVRPEHMVLASRRSGPVSLARPAVVRFRSFVKHGPGCWLWQGSTMADGYGQFRYYDEAAGWSRMTAAHRFAWELENGPIQRGHEIIHRCGVRSCVRTDHMVLADPAVAAREPTPQQVEILRRLAETGRTYGALKAVAAQMGLEHDTVLSAVYLAKKRLGVATTKAALEWLAARDEEALKSDPAKKRGDRLVSGEVIPA